jgi:hypothetical protein
MTVELTTDSERVAAYQLSTSTVSLTHWKKLADGIQRSVTEPKERVTAWMPCSYARHRPMEDGQFVPRERRELVKNRH